MTKGAVHITKTTILDTAYKLLNEIGYKKMTMRAISKETGLSMGAITHHFKTKADIVYRVTRVATKNFYNEMVGILNKYDLDLISHDTVYISCWLNIFLTNERCLNYYYDLLQDNVLSRCLAERTFMNYLRKANYLQCNLSNQQIYAYALVLTGTLSEFVRGKKEKQLRLSTGELIEIYNRQYLAVLGLSESQIKAIFDQTNQIYKRISFDATDIFDIKLYDTAEL
ncbi:hypothetical protein EUCA11A_40810 [Eubacterium callanderi]|uniref:TetR/AcrR family transcriptional regulator n=1 Tax=Eubacterium callanderi TaxID=53442 RepID=UPI0029FF49D0|nr:helix-turn-helix domain-containing protein [Eubacterium callanderi]WPK69891.1 hypothetical protein EUCA2A_40810 [Eubacterium callanderi]WPK74189.1 hypothetical protein EUCA11A_40810 [Eubacterium callanderi]